MTGPLRAQEQVLLEASWRRPLVSEVLRAAHSLALANALGAEAYGCAAAYLQGWASSFEGEAVLEPSESASSDIVPCVLYRDELLEVVFKPSQWAMSWNVSLNCNFQKADSAESVPFDEDTEPWGRENKEVRPEDLLFWLRCEDAIRKSCSRQHEKVIRRDRACSFGILHRLDCETSGPVLVANSYRDWAWLQLQFHAQKVKKKYVCLVHGEVTLEEGFFIRRALAKVRVPGRLAMRSRVASKEEHKFSSQATTEILNVTRLYKKKKKSRASNEKNCDLPHEQSYSLVEVRLWTGRLHQIRAHLAAEGHPLVSDRLYGGRAVSWCPAFFLHCFSLAFSPDLGADPVDIRCALPRDKRTTLATHLTPRDDASALSLRQWIIDPEHPSSSSDDDLLSSRRRRK